MPAECCKSSANECFAYTNGVIAYAVGLVGYAAQGVHETCDAGGLLLEHALSTGDISGCILLIVCCQLDKR